MHLSSAILLLAAAGLLDAAAAAPRSLLSSPPRTWDSFGSHSAPAPPTPSCGTPLTQCGSSAECCAGSLCSPLCVVASVMMSASIDRGCSPLARRLNVCEPQKRAWRSETAVVSLGFGSRYWPELSAHVRANRADYCQRHGYHCLLSMSDLMTNCSHDLDSLHLVDPPSWSKVVAIRSCLRHYATVAWIDMDAVIVNRSITIESIAEECPGKSVLVSGNTCDPPPSTNGGFLVVRHIQTRIEERTRRDTVNVYAP